MKRLNAAVCSISLCCCILLCCKKNDALTGVADAPVYVSGKTYSAEDIIAFKQMALNATTNNTVIKLPKNVSVFLADTGYTYMTAEITSIINELNQLLDTNLVITRTMDKAASDIQIFLTDRDTFLAAVPAAIPYLQNTSLTGLAYVSWNSKGVIYRSSVFADMYRTNNNIQYQRYLIHHEFMHALGFLNHLTTPGIYTILSVNNTLPGISYSYFDKRMMQLLYNPSIKAGMNEFEFNEAVKNL